MIVKKYKGHDVPEGATHYCPANDYQVETFIKKGYFWCALDGTVWMLDKSPMDNKDIIKIPQEPDQFVPVVGEECELTPHNAMWGFSNGKPVVCTVVGFYCDWIVVAEEHCAPITTRLDKCDLAPIKSEREKVVDEAVGVMNLALDDSQDGWANALYDAGMLVMPESNKC